jgi:hypothetical protein
LGGGLLGHDTVYTYPGIVRNTALSFSLISCAISALYDHKSFPPLGSLPPWPVALVIIATEQVFLRVQYPSAA